MELLSSLHSNIKSIPEKKEGCKDSDCHAIVFQMREGTDFSTFPSQAARAEIMTVLKNTTK